MSRETPPLVPAETVRVRWRDAGALPPMDLQDESEDDMTPTRDELKKAIDENRVEIHGVKAQLADCYDVVITVRTSPDAAERIATWVCQDVDPRDFSRVSLAARIRAALAEREAETIERCARVAEGYDYPGVASRIRVEAKGGAK